MAPLIVAWLSSWKCLCCTLILTLSHSLESNSTIYSMVKVNMQFLSLQNLKSASAEGAQCGWHKSSGWSPQLGWKVQMMPQPMLAQEKMDVAPTVEVKMGSRPFCRKKIVTFVCVVCCPSTEIVCKWCIDRDILWGSRWLPIKDLLSLRKESKEAERTERFSATHIVLGCFEFLMVISSRGGQKGQMDSGHKFWHLHATPGISRRCLPTPAFWLTSSNLQQHCPLHFKKLTY